MKHSSRASPLGLVVAAAGALLLCSGEVLAQVEFRCPAGWSRADNAESLRPAPDPHARDAVALCSGGPHSTISFTVDQLDPPLPSESDWLSRRLPGIATPATFVDTHIPGVPGPARLLEWATTQPAQGHHSPMAQYGRAEL